MRRRKEKKNGERKTCQVFTRSITAQRSEGIRICMIVIVHVPDTPSGQDCCVALAVCNSVFVFLTKNQRNPLR